MHFDYALYKIKKYLFVRKWYKFVWICWLYGIFLLKVTLNQNVFNKITQNNFIKKGYWQKKQICSTMCYKEGAGMAISVRLSDEDSQLFRKYAEINNMTISELVRQAVMERIEDEYDLKAYYEAMDEFNKNSVTYTHEEVKRMLELDWCAIL